MMVKRKTTTASEWVAIAALILVSACKPKAPPPSETTTAPTESAPIAAPSAVSPEPTVSHLASPVSPVEARRRTITKLADEPLLAAGGDVLARQVPAAPGYDVQLVDLACDGRHAALIAKRGARGVESLPFLAVLDDHGAVAWTRDRPAGGIMPPFGSIALAPGPKGKVALAVCDEPTRTVALRLLDDDGSPFADFPSLEVDACDEVSLLYWPHHGWIVVAASAGTTRARLVTESGAFGWGRGLDLGARSRPQAIAPASLAADTEDSFVLVQVVQPSGEVASPFHALAFRYDAAGAPIWKAAVDLGELGGVAAPDRVVLEPTVPVGVRARLGSALDVEVQPSGDLKGRAPR